MRKEKNNIITYNDGVELRQHNKRVVLAKRKESDFFEVSFQKINKETIEIKGAKNVAAYSNVNEKGLMTTCVRMNEDSIKILFILYNEYKKEIE